MQLRGSEKPTYPVLVALINFAWTTHHHNKIKVPDPVVKDLISKKWRTKYNKIARLIVRYGNYIYFKYQCFKRHGLSSSGSYKEWLLGQKRHNSNLGVYVRLTWDKTAHITTFDNVKTKNVTMRNMKNIQNNLLRHITII